MASLRTGYFLSHVFPHLRTLALHDSAAPYFTKYVEGESAEDADALRCWLELEELFPESSKTQSRRRKSTKSEGNSILTKYFAPAADSGESRLKLADADLASQVQQRLASDNDSPDESYVTLTKQIKLSLYVDLEGKYLNEFYKSVQAADLYDNLLAELPDISDPDITVDTVDLKPTIFKIFPSFQQFVQCGEAVKHFTMYIKADVIPTITFLQDVDIFRMNAVQGKGKQDLVAEAKAIYNEFISDRARTPVSLSMGTKYEVQQAYEDPPPEVFDKAYDEVVAFLGTVVLSDFCKDDSAKRLLALLTCAWPKYQKHEREVKIQLRRMFPTVGPLLRDPSAIADFAKYINMFDQYTHEGNLLMLWDDLNTCASYVDETLEHVETVVEVEKDAKDVEAEKPLENSRVQSLAASETPVGRLSTASVTSTSSVQSVQSVTPESRSLVSERITSVASDAASLYIDDECDFPIFPGGTELSQSQASVKHCITAMQQTPSEKLLRTALRSVEKILETGVYLQFEKSVLAEDLAEKLRIGERRLYLDLFFRRLTAIADMQENFKSTVNLEHRANPKVVAPKNNGGGWWTSGGGTAFQPDVSKLQFGKVRREGPILSPPGKLPFSQESALDKDSLESLANKPRSALYQKMMSSCNDFLHSQLGRELYRGLHGQSDIADERTKLPALVPQDAFVDVDAVILNQLEREKHGVRISAEAQDDNEAAGDKDTGEPASEETTAVADEAVPEESIQSAEVRDGKPQDTPVQEAHASEPEPPRADPSVPADPEPAVESTPPPRAEPVKDTPDTSVPTPAAEPVAESLPPPPADPPQETASDLPPPHAPAPSSTKAGGDMDDEVEGADVLTAEPVAVQQAAPVAMKPPPPAQHHTPEVQAAKETVRQPVATCEHCKESIFAGDRTITLDDKLYHDGHVFCHTCAEPIVGDKFGMKDGKIFCSDDYRKLLGIKCGTCGEPIRDGEKTLTAINLHYHTDCFVCWVCKQPFENNEFFSHEGKPYCKDHPPQRTVAVECPKCKEPLTGQYISALDQKWHPDCFACFDCGKKFSDTSFRAENGKPYCPEHVPSGGVCAGCNKPISGQFVTAIDKPWHPDCFVCKVCSKKFTSSYNSIGGVPYCDEHVPAAEVCSRCEHALDGDIIKAIGVKFHARCFTCVSCQEAFGTDPFYEHDGKPYCKAHFPQ